MEQVLQLGLGGRVVDADASAPRTKERSCPSEPLQHDLTGFWSRRITDEHRLVYAVDKERVLIAQARYHY